MDCSPPGSSVHRVLQQEYWSGLLFPSLGDLTDPEIKPASLMSPALASRIFTTITTWEAPKWPSSAYKEGAKDGLRILYSGGYKSP